VRGLKAFGVKICKITNTEFAKMMTNEEILISRPTNRYFQSRYTPDPARDDVWSAICDYLQRFVPRDGVVLDLGAGYCSFINHIQASEKHALDLSEEFTRFAHSDVQAHVGGVHDLRNFSSAKFDVVFASNLLEHLTREETTRGLQEVRRILKASGRLILIQPNFRYMFREYFDDYTHLQIFSHVSLADLLSSIGYRIEEVEPRFLPFSFKSRLPKWR
jgi:ubiquinone/menaquinone biosynthesis C-methylase UbiE